MTEDREPRLQRLEDAIEAFLNRDATASGEDLLAKHEDLADLIEPMLAADGAAGSDAAGGDQDKTVVLPPDGAAGDVAAGDLVRPELREGTLPRIGELDVVREVGRGGMGIVFEAIDPNLKRRVAVKIMPRAPGMSASSIVRFRREAELAASLNHRAIVPVHSFGETDDEFYLSMALLEAAPLSAMLKSIARGYRTSGKLEIPATGVLPDATWRARAELIARSFPDVTVAAPEQTTSHIREMATVLREVADALAQAHERGVIHRDVKPANILIDAEGRPFLTDFGLACVLDDPHVTQLGVSPGTPQYMAPEQVNASHGSLSPATDVFALGVTLYEALTLTCAFPGDSLVSILYSVTTREPVDARSLNPAVPMDLVAIMQRAMEKKPADRYPSAREFADDLDAFLRGDQVSVRPLSFGARMVRRARREPWRASALLLLILGLPVVIVLAVVAGQREPEAQVGEQVLEDRWLDTELTHGWREAGEGDVDASRAHFEAILARHPDSAAAVAGLSVLARRRGDRQALGVLEKHFAIVAGSPALLRRRATLLERLGDPAAREAAGGLPTDPVDFDAFLVGYALLELGHSGKAGKFTEARQKLHRAIVTADRPRPLYYFEWLHAAAHDQHEEDVTGAIAAIKRLWPDDPTGRFWIAFAHNALGDGSAAKRALEHALAVEPTFQPAYINLAKILRHMGRSDEALELMRAKLPDASRPAEVREQIAMSLFKLRRVDEATEEFRDAIAAHPDRWQLRASYATMLMLGGNFPEAEKLMQTVVAERPDNMTLRYSLASAQLRQRKLPEARNNLETVVAQQPLASAYYDLGVACSGLADFVAAKEAYRNCVALDGAHARAMVNLANLLFRTGEVKEAEEYLRKAVVADPKLLPARRTLLRVLDGRPQEAAALCRDWAKHMPASAEPLRYLAQSLVRCDDEELLEEAMRAATDANALTGSKDGPTLHALAVVQLAMGDAQKAKATVTRAMGLLDPGDRFTPYYKQQMQATLAQCEAARKREGK